MITVIKGIDLNSDGMNRTIAGHRVHLQTRCSSNRWLEIWAWKGRKQGDAHAYMRGTSFFDGSAADNRDYFDRIVANTLGLNKDPKRCSTL